MNLFGFTFQHFETKFQKTILTLTALATLFSIFGLLLLQDLAKEIDSHIPNHNKVIEAADKHLNICSKEPEDQPVTEKEQVQHEVDHVDTRWENLTTAVKENTEQIKQVEDEATIMRDEECVLEELFREVEKTLDEQKPVNVNPEKCVKELEKIKVCIESKQSFTSKYLTH